MNPILKLLTLLLVPLALSSCSRFGISQPRAILYQNTITPLTMKRPAFGAPGVEIPEGMVETRIHAGQVELSSPIPTVGPPFLRALSAGWGDIGTEKTLRVGGIGEVVYADAHVVSILGVYTRTTVIAWGLPVVEESGEPTPPKDIE